MLCCGDKQLQLSTFLRFTDRIRETLAHSLALHPGFEKLLSLPFWPRFLAFLRSRQNTAGKRPLLALVENFRDTTATDARDKIYAMLSFALERRPSDPELQPAYSQTVRQTYTRLALWHIRKYRCLDVFAHCDRKRDLAEPSPSWVPDWRQGASRVIFPKFTVNDDPGSEPLFNASGTHIEDLKVNAPLLVDTKCLELYGAKLGETGETLPKRIAQTRGIEVEKTTWRPVDGSKLYPLNTITVEEVFWRTLYIDLKARFDEHGKTIFKREPRGDFPWPPREVADLEKEYPDIVNLKRNTIGRCLFYTLASSDGPGLMGLGPHDARVGDPVWILNGGRVLYVLRHKDVSEALPCQSIDLSTGGSEHKTLAPADTVYDLVGECFILGLMDGKPWTCLAMSREDHDHDLCTQWKQTSV